MNANQNKSTSGYLAWITIGFCAGLLLAGAPQDASAQAGAPKTKAPAAGTKSTTTTPPAKTPTKPASLTAEDIAAKEQFMQTPEWRQTMHNFEQWLSAQSIYDAEQVKQIRKRMALGIERMTPGQLVRFHSDIEEKLAVLTSADAKQAGTYLAETFAAASPAYARKIRAKLPDVLTMTAAQIDQQLDIFAAKHAAALQTQRTFEADRQQSIAYNEAQLAAMRSESDQAMNRASAAAAQSGKSGSNAAARDYFPGVGNDGPFGPGTSYGGGFGGFGFF